MSLPARPQCMRGRANPGWAQPSYPPSCQAPLRSAQRRRAYHVREGNEISPRLPKDASPSSDQPMCHWGISAVAALCMAMSGPAWAKEASPYELAKTLPYGVVEATGALRSCPSNINPNCVATTISGSTNDAEPDFESFSVLTSSMNIKTYSPAWRANETDPARAARALEEAFQDLFGSDEGRLLTSQTIDGLGEYRAFGVKSAFGVDVAEFLITSESSSRGQEEGALVTYRSMAGSTKYIWPIQQPIGDFEAQRKRMISIRQLLGWQVIGGCEIIETCYD